VNKCQKNGSLWQDQSKDTVKTGRLKESVETHLRQNQKETLEKTEMQDDKQTNGSNCLKLKRRKSVIDKEKTKCFKSTPSYPIKNLETEHIDS